MKKFLYLPSNYKNRRYRKVAGRAKTGEVSPKGLVAHTEDWEGRIAADVAPSTLRYIVDKGRIRKMTLKEMVEHGYFHIGRGPKGIRPMKEGIHVED